MLDEWERRSPGRRQVLFRALSNVRPSHLLDTELFGFGELGTVFGELSEIGTGLSEAR